MLDLFRIVRAQGLEAFDDLLNRGFRKARNAFGDFRARYREAVSTVNKDGYLYVTNYTNNVVVEFAPGSTTPLKRQISKGLYTPEGTAYFPPLLP
jgi:hypothetical protein